ncbi:M13-type metalloendopeptidase [Eupransor demetentiae]|uniref:Predicted metalloendopeptidase (PepO) n=1 Tax=Eupransor demetentiae TaxID=3109584 RepID=A0ABM9N587_9LACO|nr:Predicted metalloendopeptidase (PepO) [Lactobacillaceae bacterium LMG 33000]
MLSYKEDFYQAVNGEWIDQAEIAPDKPSTSSFNDLSQKIEKIERADLAAFEAGEKEIPANLKGFVAMHQLTKDWDTRQAAGTKEAQAWLHRLSDIQDWQTWQKAEGELLKDGYSTPLEFYVAPDSKDTSINELWLSTPDVILPDTTTYDDAEQSQRMLALWQKMVLELLPHYGYSEAESKDLVEKTLAFDRLLAKYLSSNEEMSDYWKNYHPTDLADLQAKLSDYDLSFVLQETMGQKIDRLIISDAKFWNAASKIYTAENFEEIKAWSLVQMALQMAPMLSNDLRILAGQYGRALSGIQAASGPEKSAFKQARAFFAPLVGRWYGQTYFGPQGKADVTAMVKKLIKIYQSRFDQNDWLSPETLKEAKVKLNALKIQVGYPERVPAYLEKRVVDTNQSLLANAMRFSKESIAFHLAKWHQKPDDEIWSMSADTVNAYYNPDFNQIVFPAAILQAPFYSLEQSDTENLGGVGSVIAHEITHAFDTNGARYDEHGNLKEWWQPVDFEQFEKRTKLVEEQFDGLESGGAKVNGHLTVSENVADLGGLSAALSAAQEKADFDAQEFFKNFARIWRQKASQEYLQLLAAIDVHAPARLRVDVPVKNFDAFAKAFDVHDGDGMWLAPEKRVQIW